MFNHIISKKFFNIGHWGLYNITYYSRNLYHVVCKLVRLSLSVTTTLAQYLEAWLYSTLVEHRMRHILGSGGTDTNPQAYYIKKFISKGPGQPL